MPAKKSTETAQLESVDPAVAKPRLVKLIIKNYRCIGPKAVEIELNDIVVLVGANNAGKSSILKAYELAMSQGSEKANLLPEDFPGGQIDPLNSPEIEIHTVVYDDTVGSKWVEELSGGDRLVKEKWVWEKEGKPKRFGWNTDSKQWDSEVPWGAPNVANNKRPEPHRVNAFDSPDAQALEIQKLMMKVLKDGVKRLHEDGENKTAYSALLRQVKGLQTKIVADSQAEIDTINKELSQIIDRVFPGYKIDFDAKPEDDIENAINWFKSNPQLLMGLEGGHLSTIDRQGSGARRTLLWTAIKFLAEDARNTKPAESTRPHLLLIDEPEICLHPNAIRDACNALYDLPSSGKWQVMLTTHSPVFVDFSKDNTTIIRVERDETGEVQGSIVFRPATAKLGEDDRSNLKLLNMCDPYVAEFFFGGRVIIVEGDTEFTAFNYIKSQDLDTYRDVHIIRARGKATIVSLAKILNQFGSRYAVLHDSDTPKTADGTKTNPAWTTNSTILATLNDHPNKTLTRLLASVPNFEEAYLDTKTTKEKPYAALSAISKNPKLYSKIKLLLDALLNFDAPLPGSCIEWSKLEDLELSLSKGSATN